MKLKLERYMYSRAMWLYVVIFSQILVFGTCDELSDLRDIILSNVEDGIGIRDCKNEQYINQINSEESHRTCEVCFNAEEIREGCFVRNGSCILASVYSQQSCGIHGLCAIDPNSLITIYTPCVMNQLPIVTGCRCESLGQAKASRLEILDVFENALREN